MNLRTLAALLLLALPLCAQSWDELRGLKPGDAIKVQDSDGKEYKGRFTAVAPESISVETGKGQISIDRPRVRRVEIRSGGKRLRNTLIGAGIGIAVAVTVDQTLGTRLRNEGNDTGRGLMYAAPIGGFTALGALPAAYTTIYRVR